MTGAEIVALVSALLPLIVQFAPGLLAAITSRPDDGAALAHARAVLNSIPWSPARHAIESR